MNKYIFIVLFLASVMVISACVQQSPRSASAANEIPREDKSGGENTGSYNLAEKCEWVSDSITSNGGTSWLNRVCPNNDDIVLTGTCSSSDCAWVDTKQSYALNNFGWGCTMDFDNLYCNGNATLTISVLCCQR